jgi:transposase
MSQPRISMHRLQDLVRHHRLGRKPSRVAKLLGMTRKTERAYRKSLIAEGLLAGSADELPSQEELAAALERQRPPKLPAQQVSTAAAWRDEIETLSKGGAQPRAIYDALVLKHGGDFSASYHSVRRLARRLQAARGVQPGDVAIPLTTRPGLEAQVDFGFVGHVFDPKTARERKAWVFTLTLSHSRHRVDLLVFDQSTETWAWCHEESFRRLAGVPETIVPDNLKSAVIRRAFSVQEETKLTRSYRELARHYGFTVDPTPVRSPEKKGKVESGVRYVKRNFFATRDLKREDADVLQRELARWTVQIAGQRTHGTTRRQPLQAFEEEERGALLPLPREPYEAQAWAKLKVHRDSHVRVGKAFYSVPFVHLGIQAWVCSTSRSVVVYADHKRIATHPRVAPGEWSTVEEHLPEHRAPYRHRDPRYWRERAALIGTEVARYVDAVLDQDAALSHLGHAQRAVLCLEDVPAKRAEAACRRALHFENLKPAALKKILDEGLDSQPLPDEEPLSAAEDVPRFARSAEEIASGAGDRGAA